MELNNQPQPNVYSEKDLDKTEGEGIDFVKQQHQVQVEDPDSWQNEEGQQNFMLASADALINWARASSVWQVNAGLACCAFEMISTASSRFDISRFGMEIFRPSPRQADLLIVGRGGVEMQAQEDVGLVRLGKDNTVRD